MLTALLVYPGDSLTNTFTLNPLTMKWHNNWINIPGPAGTAAGEAAFSGGLVFDPKDYDDDSKSHTAGSRTSKRLTSCRHHRRRNLHIRMS